MFFMVSETNAAQEAITAILGPVGRMVDMLAELQKAPPMLNVSLWTKELGKIWYGDIKNVTELQNLKPVARQLKESIFVIPEWQESDVQIFMNAGTPWNIVAIDEVTPI